MGDREDNNDIQQHDCGCSNIPCGCKDVTPSGPCGYSLCTTGNERCDDVQCTECVSYCGSTFQIETASGLLKIESGERLDQIVQKFALMIANGLGACTADNVHHAPYNVYSEAVSNNKLTIVWDGISSLSTGFNIYFDTVVTPTGWVQANTAVIVPTETTFEVTNLLPDTEYKFKILAIAGASTCSSVEILVSTLA